MTTKNYFSKCETPAGIKSLYRKLAMENHPDHGGSTRIMQDINAAYHAALKGLDGIKVGTYKNGNDRRYKYNYKTENSVIEKYAEILRAKLPARITVEIVGIYIWVSNTKFADRDELKSLKMIWHGKRMQWYWKPAGYVTRYNPKLSNDDLRTIYGSRVLTKEEPNAAAIMAS